jgi:glycosyl transferase, family 25
MEKSEMVRAPAWLGELFPYRVCINLDRRPERWRRMRRRLSRHGLAPVERFPAVDGAGLTPPAGWEDPAGAYGCLLSHVAAVREAERRGAPSVLIFEDDAAFSPDFMARFAACAAELPADWAMLHLGGLHELDPVPVSERVARLTSTYSTYAYAVRHTAYAAFLALNGQALAPVDYNNRELQKELPCYGFVPNLVWVDGG